MLDNWSFLWQWGANIPPKENMHTVKEKETPSAEEKLKEKELFGLLPVWLTPAYANSAFISNSIGLR